MALSAEGSRRIDEIPLAAPLFKAGAAVLGDAGRVVGAAMRPAVSMAAQAVATGAATAIRTISNFAKHHAIPKFLGGFEKQIRARLGKLIHNEFHSLLRAELRKDFPRWLLGASTKEWLRHFAKNPGSQKKAFEAVWRVSEKIDALHNTRVAFTFMKNFIMDRFEDFL